MKLYAVFAKPYTRPGDFDFLAVYSSEALANELISCQDASLRDCLTVVELEVDRHPEDDYWKHPGRQY